MRPNIQSSALQPDQVVSAQGKTEPEPVQKFKNKKHPARRPMPSKKERKEVTTAEAMDSWRSFKAKHLDKS